MTFDSNGLTTGAVLAAVHDETVAFNTRDLSGAGLGATLAYVLELGGDQDWTVPLIAGQVQIYSPAIANSIVDWYIPAPGDTEVLPAPHLQDMSRFHVPRVAGTVEIAWPRIGNGDFPPPTRIGGEFFVSGEASLSVAGTIAGEGGGEPAVIVAHKRMHAGRSDLVTEVAGVGAITGFFGQSVGYRATVTIDHHLLAVFGLAEVPMFGAADGALFWLELSGTTGSGLVAYVERVSGGPGSGDLSFTWSRRGIEE